MKKLFLIAIASTTFFLFFSSKISAQCATDCGWTGTGPGSQCVAYQTGGDCGWQGSTCICMNVVGCQSVGPWPNSCDQAFTAFNPAPASCCGGGTTPTSPPGGGGPTAPPGWGGCGSCDCKALGIGDNPQCRTNDQGNCVWDPGGCSSPPEPPQPPSCSISLSPNPVTAVYGETTPVVANVNVSNGGTDSVVFSVQPQAPNTTVPISINPSVDSNSPYRTDVTVNYMDEDQTKNVARVSARANVSGPGGSATCSNSALVRLIPPVPWWQAKGGATVTNGILESHIATGCTIPACNPLLILDNPAPAVYGGLTYDFAASTSSLGSSSSRNWLSRTTTYPKYFTYSEIMSFLPTDITLTNLGTTIRNANLASAPVGYSWYQANGNVTIDGNIIIGGGKKIILFVQGNLLIRGNINYASNADSFLVIIVGRNPDGTQGNITIDPTVGGGKPTISAVMQADNIIRTSVSDTQIHIFGAAVALGRFNLERDLVNQNINTPSEYFEYDPRIPLLYPSQLTKDFVIWREVAP